MQRLTLLVLASLTFFAPAAFGESSEDAWLGAVRADFFSDDARTDFNGDGVVDFLDLGILSGSSAGSLDERLEFDGIVVEPPVNILFFTLAGDTQPISNVSVSLGEVLLLDLHMSFDETTVGGGITLDFDPAVLVFDDAVFDMTLGDDPLFRCPNASPPPGAIPCALSGDDFVSFGGVQGFTGDARIATLELTALATGSSSLSFAVTRVFSDTTGNPIEVPEPMGGGLAVLITLGVLRLRRSARA